MSFPMPTFAPVDEQLTYIKKEELASVRQPCTRYRAFQENLKTWRQLTAVLEQHWKQLQQAQSR